MAGGIFESGANEQSAHARPSNEVTGRERVHDPRYVHDIEVKTEKH
jgi:hypothetical protein